MEIYYDNDFTEKSERVCAEIDIAREDESSFVYYLAGGRWEKFFEGLEIKNHIYYTACDVLSIEFNTLSSDLFCLYTTALKQEYEVPYHIRLVDKIASTLDSYHPLLIDDTIGDLIYEKLTTKHRGDISHIFSGEEYITLMDGAEEHSWASAYFFFKPITQIVLIKKYVDSLVNGFSYLSDPHIFLTFANNCIEKPVYDGMVLESPLSDIDAVFSEFASQALASNNLNARNYILPGLLNFMTSSVYEVLRRGLTFKQCAICGKYFVPYNRSDTLYCDRTSPVDSSKSCKEYGAIKSYQDNLKNSVTMGLYRKIYMQKQMLAKRNAHRTKYKEDFESFKSQSKQWKTDVKVGTKTDAEYLEWLKAIKEKKV